MQRQIIIIVFYCILALYAKKSFTQDKQELNIKGSVSSYEEIEYNTTHKNIDSSDAKILCKTKKKFDNKGNIIGDQRGDFTYSYEGTNKTQMFIGVGENKELACSYKYNNNKLVEIIYHARKKRDEQKERFSYYSDGWTSKLFSYDDKPIRKFLVNEQKKKVQVEQSGLTFVCGYKDYFWRPKTSKMLTCKGCKRQESREAIIKYDKQGNLQYISNYVQHLRINGETISSFSTSFDPSTNYVQHYKYEYDSVGNWTMRKCYNNEGRLLEWKERIYDYKEFEKDNTYY